MLGAFRYQPNRATLHTDTALLPANRRAWASWNYVRAAMEPGGATLTYYLNRLQGLPSEEPVLVTLNRDEAIDPRHVIARFDYSHPDHRPGCGQRPVGPARLERRDGLLLRRLLGLRVPRRRGPERARRSASDSVRGCDEDLLTPATQRALRGTVTHRRAEPGHRFTSKVALPLLFLDEVPGLGPSTPWSTSTRAPTGACGPPPSGSTATTTSRPVSPIGAGCSR